MAKGSSEAEIEFEHALAIGFHVRSVGSLEGEATVGPLAICMCRRDGTDVSIRVDYESFSGTSSTQFRALSSPTTPQFVLGVHVSRKGTGGAASLDVFPEGLVVPA